MRVIEALASRVGGFHAYDVNRLFDSSACLLQVARPSQPAAPHLSVSKPAEMMVKQERTAQTGSPSVWAGSPPPASNDIMGCDRGTRLSVLWIHLHPV